MAYGGCLSPSSLKADCVTPELTRDLAAGGTPSATVAPETGSERLRRVIHKNLTEADILCAATLLVGEGVPDLKLYFMFGLPTEPQEDVEEIGHLVANIRATLRSEDGRRSRVGRITVSANPFVPKPWTPFQWDGMMPIAKRKNSARLLERNLGRLPGLRFDCESPREAFYQTLRSRGDRRVARFLVAVYEGKGDWWSAIRAWSSKNAQRPDWSRDLPPPEEFVHRTYGEHEPLPSDFIDHHISKQYLRTERCKTFAAVHTPLCDTSTCRSYQACPP